MNFLFYVFESFKMKRLKIGMILFVNLFVIFSTWADSQDSLLNRAEQLIETENYDRAIMVYDQALQEIDIDNYALFIKTANKKSALQLKLNNADGAKQTLDSTLYLAKNHLSQNHHSFIDIYNQYARYYWLKAKYQEAVHHGRLAKKLLQQLNLHDPEQTISIFVNLGYTFGFQGEVDSSLYYFQRASDLTHKNFNDPLLRASRNMDIAFAYVQKGDYENARKFLEEALQIHKEHLPPDHARLAKNYNNLSYVTIELWDHEQAIHYTNQGLNILKNTQKVKSRSGAIAYMNLAAAYLNKGDYQNALVNNIKAEELFLEIMGTQNPYLGTIYLNMSYIYEGMQDPENQYAYLSKSLKFRQSLYGEKSPETLQSYRALGEFHLSENQLEQARSNLQKAIDISKEVLPPKNPLLSETILNMGQLYLKQGKYDEALLALQESMVTLVEGFDDMSIHSNPSLSNIQAKMNLLLSLTTKTNAWSSKYLSEGKTEDLQFALETVKTADKLIDTLRISYQTKESKQILVKNAIPFYEDAIFLAKAAYDTWGGQDYQELAFQFFEKNKSILLLEEIKQSEAVRYAGIPDSLINLEKSLKFDINYYQEQLHLAKIHEDSTAIFRFEQKLNNQQAAYQNLKLAINQKHPNYYRFKYHWQPIQLAHLQKDIIDKNSAVLEYFVGETKIFAALISKKGFQVFTTKISNEYQDAVNEIRRHLSDINLIHQNDKKAIETYHTAAEQLYQLILKEPLLIAENLDHLVIIPDGSLGYIPFEALTEDASAGEYLIQKFPVSYAYSATIFSELKKTRQFANKNVKGNYAGFAPKYEKNLLAMQDDYVNKLVRDGNLDLPGATREVSQINKIVDGDVWMNLNATELNFKDRANDYNIIHLAMHGLLNDDEPMLSKLVFTHGGDSIEDGFLNAYEIYNLELNAELAVLSACNTASGKIKRGEGIMSLSRAFVYAGCPSILASLWKAPDQATSEIMINFYKNLKSGKDKASALRQAKLDFMENNPGIFNHPFYWSGFIPIGDMKPVQIEQGFKPEWWFLIAVILIAIFYLIIRKKKPADFISADFQ